MKFPFAVFGEFVRKLESKAGTGSTINIILRHSAVGKGIYDYQNLLALIGAKEGAVPSGFMSRMGRGHHARPPYLVFLEEETTDSKKKLRLQIKSALHGIDREKMLRQIVLVITFDNQNWQQLEDDITYFKDNFGGIGFRPLSIPVPASAAAPVSAAAGVQPCDLSMDISQCLVDHYQIEPGVQANAVCKTVCENRQVFHIAWALCLLLLSIFATLHYASCHLLSAAGRVRSSGWFCCFATPSCNSFRGAI